ncbi:MAG: peptidase C45 [Planctomyces sp.]|nr:peptidase C45 [Planctomyces sp.]
MNSRYPEFVVGGSNLQIGQQIGHAFRDSIRRFTELGRMRIHETLPVTDSQIDEICQRSLAYVEKYSPEYLEELRGMSEGSGRTLIDLMLLQIRNQFHGSMNSELAADSGCTSLSISHSRSATETPIVAQNWDNDGALDEFTVVVTRRPVNRPATLCITQTGLIAYIGINEFGIGACLNSLPAPSRVLGVPHYFTLRRLLESHSVTEAVAAVETAERAIPANIMLSTPEGPRNLEVTVDTIRVLHDEGCGLLTHTNHCIHPDLVAINQLYPELIQSGPRKCRIDHLLTGKPRISINDLKSAFADHNDFPQSICRHRNIHPPHGCWETVFSVIMLPEERRLLATRGNPCDSQWEEYILQPDP